MANLERGEPPKARSICYYWYAGPRTSESSWTSWLIPMFVVANLAVFIVTMSVNNCPKNNLGFEGKCVAGFLGRFSFEPLNENPLLGPSSDTLAKMGALLFNKVVHRNQTWRLFTCFWLHAGVVHVLANMLCLIYFGILLEQRFGFVRVGIIYLLSGLGGSILSALFNHNGAVASVGASGAVIGLTGAMLSDLLTNWSIYTNKFLALAFLVLSIAVSFIPILPHVHVDNFAHIGGLVSGFLLGFVLLFRSQVGVITDPESGNLSAAASARVKSRFKVCQLVLCALAFSLAMVGYSVGLVMLFRGGSGKEL